MLLLLDEASEHVGLARTLEVNAMEDLVGGVVRASDADERDRSRLEHEHLPRLARLVALVGHDCPIRLVDGRLHVVAVRTIVAIPQQYSSIVCIERQLVRHEYKMGTQCFIMY